MIKSLIIENGRDAPELLQSFIDASPDLVGKPYLLNNARSESQKELIHAISLHDILLVESTFVHVGQVEKIIDAIWNGVFGKKAYTIYLMYAKSKLNRWVKEDPYLGVLLVSCMMRRTINLFMGQELFNQVIS
jgi:hypothetical protein